MLLFYIILIVRVDGFFIPCEMNIDCEDLDSQWLCFGPRPHFIGPWLAELPQDLRGGGGGRAVHVRDGGGVRGGAELGNDRIALRSCNYNNSHWFIM